MDILCREWTGQAGRTRPPAQPQSGPTAGESRALLRRWRQSLGQAGSGGWSRQFLSGRTLVAAQPTASSMETARPLSHQVPLAVHCSLPLDWSGRRVCVRELTVQGSATERGRFQTGMYPDGLHSPDHPPPALSLRTLSPSQTPPPPLVWPSLLSALSCSLP